MKFDAVGLTIRALFVTCALSVPLYASEERTCQSPDGKFALRCVSADAQPYNGETAIIEVATHKNVFSLNPNWFLSEVKLVWSPDSQRVAYFFETEKGYSTRILFRNGSSFKEIALPQLPSPKLPQIATTGSDAETKTRIEPIKWIGSKDLLLEEELLNPAWGRAAQKITLGFDENNQPLIRNAEQEKVTIVDYFLLLPPKNFEAPLSAWLRHMRTGGVFYPCEEFEHPGNLVDEKNGYLRCSGDGAQPEFEVALFRHRDGRPLLAVCSGELEGNDSVYLTFFELGPDGKMQEIKHSMFPGAERDYDSEVGEGKGEWRFVLPREGRTIAVRMEKGKKIKFTWTGEKFVEQK